MQIIFAHLVNEATQKCVNFLTSFLKLEDSQNNNNKIRDLFKVKLYAIRSETKKERERKKREREKKKEREREKKERETLNIY